MDTYQLGFIGAGKLAGSVIRGLMRAKFCPPNKIIASEPNEQTRAALKKETSVSVTTDNAEVAEKSEVIFIGVKPPMVLPVLAELKDKLQNKLVMSLAMVSVPVGDAAGSGSSQAFAASDSGEPYAPGNSFCCRMPHESVQTNRPRPDCSL